MPALRPAPAFCQAVDLVARAIRNAIRANHSLRAQRLKKFKILKFSSEIENFKRAAHQTPIFCFLWGIQKVGLEMFSIEIENFKDLELKISIEIDFFSIFEPLGLGFPIRASHLIRANHATKSMPVSFAPAISGTPVSGVLYQVARISDLEWARIE